MLAHGFTNAMLDALVRAGLATATPEIVHAGGGASCIGDPTARLPFITSAYRVGAAGLSRKVMMNATTSCSSWLDSNGFAMRKFFGTAGSVSR
jgi:hypothetical protein